MKKLVHLFWGIITKPQKTFLEIRKSSSIREGLMVTTISLLFGYLQLYFHPEIKLEDLGLTTPFKFVAFFLIALSIYFILAGILHSLAKARKLDSTYPRVLNIFLFSSAPQILLFPLQSLLIASKINIAYTVIGWIGSLWSITLIIIGINVSLSIKKRSSIYLCLRSCLIPLILIGFILFMVIFMRAHFKEQLSELISVLPEGYREEFISNLPEKVRSMLSEEIQSVPPKEFPLVKKEVTPRISFDPKCFPEIIGVISDIMEKGALKLVVIGSIYPKIRIRFRAPSFTDVFSFVRILEASPIFKYVEIKSMRKIAKEKANGYVEYIEAEVVCDIDERANDRAFREEKLEILKNEFIAEFKEFNK